MSNRAQQLAEKKMIEEQKAIYRKKCREVRDQLEEEQRQYNFYIQERDRINYIWMLQKKKIEDAHAELANKQREKEDMEETHKIENKLYYQKIKYIMLKHEDENVELQKQAEITLKQIEDANRVKEKDYKYDVRSLSKIKKEQEVLQTDFMHALDKDYIKSLHLLKSECQLKEYQIRRFYREKMKEMKINASEKRNKKIEEITAKKTKEIKKLTEEHSSAFNSMKNYYFELNKKNLSNLKNLATHFSAELQKQGNLKGKKLYRLNQMKKIEKPLQDLKEEIQRLILKEKECQESFEHLKLKNEEYKERIKLLLDLEYKYEVTLQKISYLEKEKESFLEKYRLNLHTIEQKSGLRNIILEKKLEILEDNIEIKEVQLMELVRKLNLNPNAVMVNLNTTLEEVELMKGEMINQLEDELKRIKETHVNMIKTYDAKLAEFGIPVEEMGFEPLIPVDIKNE